MNTIFTLAPDEADVAVIFGGLVAFNKPKFPGIDERQFGLFVYDDKDTIIAGITGKLLYEILHINYVWVAEPMRAQGLGRKLMQQIEVEAERLDMANIYVETYSFQAPAFYEKLGFIEIGRYTDYPKSGLDKILFKKNL